MKQAAQQVSPDVVELRIPCRAEWVALARLAAAAVANRLRLSIEDIEDIKLAVAEACTAVIQNPHHGEFVEVRCEALPGTLELRVRDSGRQSAAAQPLRALDFDEARVAGLGVFLIRTLMDEVSYDVHPEAGVDLKMVKRLNSQS
ncbi:MAG: ATP-binding protein [Candidatus Eremiobacteraeota bacterium]|nr:ATP-binding protein [Candidatus Eremiobacteraeota bacterium]